MREESRDWWEQAKRDLRAAEKIYAAPEYYAAVFFCQQSAEKALKALHIEQKRSMPPPTT